MYKDKTLCCKECGDEFTFSASEQEFYNQKGFTNEPARCPKCRAAKKAQRRGSRNQGNSHREMHKVICSSCGKSTTVPFKPTGDKPVYCKDCYQSRKNR